MGLFGVLSLREAGPRLAIVREALGIAGIPRWATLRMPEGATSRRRISGRDVPLPSSLDSNGRWGDQRVLDARPRGHGAGRGRSGGR